MRKLILGFLFAALLGVHAFAAGEVPIQQIPTRLDACGATAYATAAVNNTATATITVPSGQYAYICTIEADVCADATGAVVQTNVTFTTTNLPSNPTFQYSFASTANTCVNPPIKEPFLIPLRSAAPGTNVTVVSPAINLHNTYTIRVLYYLAP